MQNSKKKLFGLAGLVAVGTMTAVAISMPSIDASAVDTANMDVQVTVVSNVEGSAIITAPQDGSTLTDKKITVNTTYNGMKSLTYTLVYKDKNGNTQRVDMGTYNLTDSSGTNKFDFDLSSYDYGDFTIEMTGVTLEGLPFTGDSVGFRYSAVSSNIDPDTEQPGKDPIIDIEIDDDVEYVEVEVYDKDGNPVLDKDGNQVIIKVDKDQVDPETGEIKVKIPLSDYGVPEGEYIFVIKGYDKDGNIISVTTHKFKYTPASGTKDPETPNTGSVLQELNISRADYIVAGLVVFAGIIGFAMYLVFKKSRC